MDAGIHGLRQEYRDYGLREEDMAADPIAQFHLWFAEVLTSDTYEPNAMTLATSTATGRPSARMVLLKSFDERGFVFFTNYDSRKSRELGENAQAALVFWWGVLHRQVRVEGAVVRVSAEESDLYYRSRPFGSRLGAWVSPQSEVIPNRDLLEQRLHELEMQYQEGDDVPRPPHWGGFCVVPDVVEFWQGRPRRLHDRLRYERQPDGTWQMCRLAP